MQSIMRHTAAVPNDAVIRVYDAAGNMIETHEHKGDFNDP
jgi:hypothetical protein